MAILIDTNIIIELVRDGGENVSNYINPKNDLIYISYVTLAEIQSFAVKLNVTVKVPLQIYCNYFG